jgi:hypothetical protein
METNEKTPGKPGRTNTRQFPKLLLSEPQFPAQTLYSLAQDPDFVVHRGRLGGHQIDNHNAAVRIVATSPGGRASSTAVLATLFARRLGTSALHRGRRGQVVCRQDLRSRYAQPSGGIIVRQKLTHNPPPLLSMCSILTIFLSLIPPMSRSRPPSWSASRSRRWRCLRRACGYSRRSTPGWCPG